MIDAPSSTFLKIGEVAAQTRVGIKTVRYYEEVGLITASQRTTSNYRLFDPGVVPRLNFIRRVQRLGFSLDEIRHILAIHDQGELPCEEVRQQVQTKISEIDQQVQLLLTLKDELQQLISNGSRDPIRRQGIICPILQPAGSASEHGSTL
ncbi:MAG: heavy metal-responsive transcriptional regulator [Synechococcaceae cyanobacterium RM1_1_27]|nr:heavy metal-responsive transcriptional regulator [Synechococcaceae cyanobacterium SM2_3_2]NJO85334.1 heavy metal-responsive transcriptional regulator [Synechococcaceae cyanobacterium RM1_1_27]